MPFESDINSKNKQKILIFTISVGVCNFKPIPFLNELCYRVGITLELQGINHRITFHCGFVHLIQLSLRSMLIF